MSDTSTPVISPRQRKEFGPAMMRVLRDELTEKLRQEITVKLRNEIMARLREIDIPDSAIAWIFDLDGGRASVHFILGPRPPKPASIKPKLPPLPDGAAEFGPWLRAYRIRNKLTQAELASILGLKGELKYNTTISRWENVGDCTLPIPIVGYLSCLEKHK